jgi:hypothetical protein
VEKFGGNGFSRPAAAPPSASSLGGSISGVVTDEEGNLLANVAISVRPVTGESSREQGYFDPSRQPPLTFSDAQGRFTVAGLPPGRYSVTGALLFIRAEWGLSGSLGAPAPDTGLAFGPPRPAAEPGPAHQPVEVREGAETKLPLPLRLGQESDF